MLKPCLLISIQLAALWSQVEKLNNHVQTLQDSQGGWSFWGHKRESLELRYPNEQMKCISRVHLLSFRMRNTEAKHGFGAKKSIMQIVKQPHSDWDACLTSNSTTTPTTATNDNNCWLLMVLSHEHL